LTTFLVVALKTERPPTPLRLFHRQNKTNKAVFSVHIIIEAKQSNRQGESQGGESSSQVI